MRLAQLGQPCQKTGLVSERRTGVVIGMASQPIGKYEDSRAPLADDSHDFKLVLPGVLHPAVRDVQGSAPTYFQNPCSFSGFALPIVHGPARSHLPLCQIENARAM